MLSVTHINSLIKIIGNRNLYMIIGNSSKNQFKRLKDIRKIVAYISHEIPPHSVVLYFGDSTDKKTPTVGYAFKLLTQKRPDLKIIMIQISMAKQWDVEKFVDVVYWHNDFLKLSDSKWGGVDHVGHPLSNTKKWLILNNKLKSKRGWGINKIFMLSGGKITLDEFKLAKKNKIPVEYFPVERKYKGDGKTRVTSTDSRKDKIGLSYDLFRK